MLGLYSATQYRALESQYKKADKLAKELQARVNDLESKAESSKLLVDYNELKISHQALVAKEAIEAKTIETLDAAVQEYKTKIAALSSDTGVAAKPNSESKEKITDKKIKYLLIIVGLYLVLFFAEIIRSSNAFQLYIHNNSINCLGELLLIDLIKLIFLMLAIMLYITWNEVILYSIVRLFFSNNSSRLYGYYKKVIFDKKTKKWKVSSDLFLLVPNSNKGSLSLVDKHCQNLEYSLQDVHQILCDVVKIKCSFHNSSETKQENRYFVRYDSSIIKEIDGRIQDYGYRLLGAPIMGGWPAYLAIFILFVFGISSKTLIEKSFKIDGTYVNINTVREKNDKIAYTFNWDDCIQIDDNKFSYDGEVAQLEPNKLSFKTGNFYGNLKRNNLHIFDEVNKSDKLYIRIDSVPYANFLNKMLDDAKIETWFDVDEDGFLDQIKVRP